MIYDVIGDIHGQADKLLGLLDILGYRHDGRCHMAPKGHKAVFVGDLIDRGTRQLDTLNIVFAMLDNAQAHAVMGNHEFNAIAYTTCDADGNYLRAHSAHNTHQHQAFLDEVGFGSALHAHWIKRFYELPIVLELGTARVIHACYDASALARLAPLLNDWRLTPKVVRLTSEVGNSVFFDLERLLKGVEIALPCKLNFVDKSGIVRHHARVKWWQPAWQQDTLDRIAFADNLPAMRAFEHLPSDLQDADFTSDKVTFVGHYWLTGTPRCLSDRVVCVDYSAGNGGALTAYRFDSKYPTLDDANFVQYG